MQTKVTVKGQVTLPKGLRESAGIRPGQFVSVRLRAEGGVIVESLDPVGPDEEYMRTLQDMMRRRPVTQFTTEEIMELSRGEG